MRQARPPKELDDDVLQMCSTKGFLLLLSCYSIKSTSTNGTLNGIIFSRISESPGCRFVEPNPTGVPEKVVEAKVWVFVDQRFDSEPFRVVDPRFSVALSLFVPFLDVPFVGFAMIVMMAIAKSVAGAWRGWCGAGTSSRSGSHGDGRIGSRI